MTTITASSVDEEIAWILTIESGNPYTYTFAGNTANFYPTFASGRNITTGTRLLWTQVSAQKMSHESHALTHLVIATEVLFASR